MLAATAALAVGLTGATPALAAPGAPAGRHDRPDRWWDDHAPAATATAPTLAPRDGAHLDGTVQVTADPTTPDDPVTVLRVDDVVLAAEPDPGTSTLAFDVGSNSADAAFGNHLLVNGHRIDLGTTVVSERVEVDVPNDVLRAGANTVEVVAGGAESSCGVNLDDFDVSDVTLTTLDGEADGSTNEFVYSMGDGSCGTNQGRLASATLTFDVAADPARTTGLRADLDTTTLANGRHTLVATTAAGGHAEHEVRVNNAPVDAPAVFPTDGTLAVGTQPVHAATPAGADGGTASLTVDGAQPPAAATLGDGAAVLSFDVGSNGIEARYGNHLLVNGTRVDLGGDHTARRVDVQVPNRLLHPGENEIVLVAGDVTSACGTNLDDFTVSDVVLTPAVGFATADLAPSYAMGDGSCGSSSTSLATATWTFDVDAPAATAYRTAGSGTARLTFDVGSNSLEARYRSSVLVNGRTAYIAEDFVSERAVVEFPHEWLQPGWNAITLVAGTFVTSCGENRDDYTVGDVRLEVAEGTATVPGGGSSWSMGDGSCGSSATPLRQVDVGAFVETAARGLRVDVDTTALADGEHRVAATSTSGAEATRTLVTDNAGPVVATSVPAAGATLTRAVPLAVTVEDPAGLLTDPRVTLDGEPVEPGTPVGPGLEPGEHTLAVEATDGVGNTATREVRFTSAGIPDAPADLAPASGATDVGRTAELSAQVSVPGGGDVTASFSETRIVTPDRAWQGTADAVPTGLSPRGERRASTRALAPADGRTLDSPSSPDVTYQRFEVAVGRRSADPVLRWSGTVDPDRVVTLHAWDHDAARWDVVATSRGAVEGDTVLTGAVDGDHVERGTVQVMVTGEDPMADDVEHEVADGFADPADHDFSLVHLTDTQYLSEGAVEQETAAEREVWESAYRGVAQWVADNVDERKIAYVAHTGDIIENNIRSTTTPAEVQRVRDELAVSSRVQEIIEASGVPNGVVAGNHDNQTGTQVGPDSPYNEFYGPARYEALSAGWQDASYGGPWRPGDNENHYDLFSAGGLDFVVVGLSYGVTREETAWASSVFERYPDRNGILLTHDYLQPSTAVDGRDAALSPVDGATLFNTVVARNPNVFLVLGGHRHGVGTNVKDAGHGSGDAVVEMLADYQFYTVSADRLGLTEVGGYAPDDQLRFGASFFRLLQFDVDRGLMTVDTYSPLLDEFGATEHDDEQRYDGSEDDTVVPVDLSSRTTSVSTDSLAVHVPHREVGERTVASGDTARVVWKGLRPDAAYAWVVTARSAGGGVTTSLPQVFVTTDDRGRPGRWERHQDVGRFFRDR
ncbi:calcineurin-like phosphoesterase family protein [Isoptericola jiangsuensis]|uniref:Calcineurin-like phosphoesterase family protein n=1 Tax=Isoptericola jiangsuensis TaxID=548579 RepID=A0A2A9EU12_9MICO|nr:calcineurin-like phosphoesterase family protein [Isoptericola jiangsuensis]